MAKRNIFVWLVLLFALFAMSGCSWPRISNTNAAGNAFEGPFFTPTKTATPAPTAVPTQTPTPAPTVPPQVLASRLGFIMPVKGAHVPEWLDLAPGAKRGYRSGTHEGVDFGYNAVGITVRVGTQVLASGNGVVVRADLNYREPTSQEMDAILARSARQGDTSADDLDKLRGRQVWIDHGQGVVTRYAHLDRTATGITVGTQVSKGQLIAYVGNSGVPNDGAGDSPHLHFEIRIGDSYLGQGLTPARARDLYVQALSGKN